MKPGINILSLVRVCIISCSNHPVWSDNITDLKKNSLDISDQREKINIEKLQHLAAIITCKEWKFHKINIYSIQGKYVICKRSPAIILRVMINNWIALRSIFATCRQHLPVGQE